MKLDGSQLSYLYRNLRDERWEAMFKQVVWRRSHFNNTRQADPRLGDWKGDKPDDDNPFKDLTAYQSTLLLQNAEEVVARVAANHYQVIISPPKEQEGLSRQADDLQSIFNSWALDIDDRRGNLQQAMAWDQYRDCYAVLQVIRNDDRYPPLDYEWRDKLRKGDEKRFRAYEPGEGDAKEMACPDCEGTGKVEADVAETPVEDLLKSGGEMECERCGGEGTIAGGGMAKGAYRERGDSYMERVARARAQAGCMWTFARRDAMSIVPVFDEDPEGGLAMCLFAQQVGLLDYLMAGGMDEAGRALEEIQKDTGVGVEQMAPGFTQGSVDYDTPSAQRWGKRVWVYQLWTRSECYEGCQFDEGGDFVINKKASGPHDYGEVPFYIVPCWDTGDPDPVFRWIPYGETLFRGKEYRDRMVTLRGGMAELTAMQQLTLEREDPKAPRTLEDGTDVNRQDGGSLGGQVPAGFKVVPIPMQVSAALAQFAEALDAEYKESAPTSGAADVSGASAPWTARILQVMAAVGPTHLGNQQIGGLTRAWRMVKRWHAKHPQEPLAAFPRNEDNRLMRGNVIRVDLRDPDDPESDGIDLDEFDLDIVINPKTEAEQVTQSEQAVSMYQAGLITEEDLYEQMGKKNPKDYAIAVRAERIAAPFKDGWISAKVGQAMGGEFLAGMNGQTLNAQGQPVAPEQAMLANGWAPQKSPNGTAGGAMGNGQVAMGSLPAVEAPGTPAMAGLT